MIKGKKTLSGIQRINDRWGFQIDTYGNHTLHEYKTGLKDKDGNDKEPEWVSRNRHCKNGVSVIKNIIQIEKAEFEESSDLEDYLLKLEALNNKFNSRLEEASKCFKEV